MNISEIAELAGVSRAAVSRYLNNGYISDEKKAKIKEVIDRTGYQPSVQAQILRTKKTKMVGVVLPKINSESISRMTAGISEILSAKGYQLLLANTGNNTEEELNYLRIFQDNYVDGIIFIATIITAKHRKLLEQMKVPVVVLGQHIKGFSCVYQNDYAAAHDIARLIVNSSKNPCYIGVTQSDEAVGQNRRQGFEAAMQESGYELSDRNVVEAGFSISAGYEQMKRLYELNPSLDGVLCATDSIAVGAFKYLSENKILIPGQVRLAGMGDSSIGNVISPSLTSVHFHYKTSGQEAARLLLEHIEDSQAICRGLKMGYELVIKESAGN